MERIHVRDIPQGDRVADGEPAALPGIKVRVRSDSAGFQAKVVRVLRDKGADFTITMRKDGNVLDAIYGISEERWAPYKTGAWKNRVCEIAEDLHVFTEAKDLPAYRMIVIRWPKEELGLFDKKPVRVSCGAYEPGYLAGWAGVAVSPDEAGRFRECK